MSSNLFGRKSIVATGLIVVAVLASGASIVYVNASRDNSAVQNQGAVQAVNEIPTEKTELAPQEETITPMNQNKVTIDTGDADCNKNTFENKSEENGTSTSTSKVTVDCKKSEGNKSSSVKIESNVSQSTQTSSSGSGSSGSAHNSTTQEITVN